MKRIVINCLLYFSVAMAGQAMAAAAVGENLQQYRESLAGARSTFNADLAHCKQLKSDERDICRAQARAVHRKADAEAIAQQRNTPQARVDARITSADADYDLARAACKAMPRKERAACLKDAKAQRTEASSHAIADLNVTQARNKAKEEKRKSYYSASLKKCDALAGAAKEACMTLARAQYGE